MCRLSAGAARLTFYFNEAADFSAVFFMKKKQTRSPIEQIKKVTRLIKALRILAANAYPLAKLLWRLYKFLGHL